MNQGKYIIFEGPDGSGKSTQINLLADWLAEQGKEVVLVREPGGTALGQKIRKIVLHHEDFNLTREAELLLFSADRAQLIAEIKEHLKQEKIVLSDRSRFSTLAYQGYGRGLDREKIEIISDFATDGMKGDIVILLDIESKKGLERRKKGQLLGREFNRLDKERLKFHKIVRKGYLQMAKADPQRWRIINADRPVEEIQKDIQKHISEII